MTRETLRKVQITCFLIAHIPLAACALVFAVGDRPLQTLLAVAFPATVVTAVLLVVYLGRVLSRAQVRDRA